MIFLRRIFPEEFLRQLEYAGKKVKAGDVGASKIYTAENARTSNDCELIQSGFKTLTGLTLFIFLLETSKYFFRRY